MKNLLGFAALAAVSMSVVQPVMAQENVEQRLQALEDMNAIEQLVVTKYATALDLMDMAAYGRLFAEDGVLSLAGMEIQGPANIENMFTAMMAPPPEGAPAAAMAGPPLPPGVLPMPALDGPMRERQVPHVITNPSYTITGDTAQGNCYWMEIMLIEGRPAIVNMGHYEDELVKIDGEWKFSRRVIMRDVPIGTSIAPPQ